MSSFTSNLQEKAHGRKESESYFRLIDYNLYYVMKI